jgi:O-antigen/teichoic acid export membrane protein
MSSRGPLDPLGAEHSGAASVAAVAPAVDLAAGTDGIARNAAFAFVVQILNAVVTAALTLFLVRKLHPTAYGIFGLAAAAAGLALLPADLGVTQAVSRYVAETRRDRKLAARVFASAFTLKLALGGFVCLVLFLGADVVADGYGQSNLAWPIRGFALAMFAQTMMTAACSTFIADGRTSLNLPVYITESGVEAAATVALVLAGGGATGAAFGKAIGFTVAAVLALWLIARRLGARAVSPRTADRDWSLRLLKYGGALVVVDSAYTLFSQIDVLLIGAFLTTAKVGLYAAPIRLIAFLQLPASAIAAGVAPRMPHARSQRDAWPLVTSLRYLALLQGALLAPILVWPDLIVRLLLGRSYDGAAVVLRGLAPYIFLLGFGTLLSVTANYLGQARRRIPIAAVTVLVNLVIDVLLIPRVGIVGGAIGTDVAYAIYAPAHLLLVRSIVPIPMRPLLIGLAQSLVAAGAMAVPLAFLHPSGWSPQVVLAIVLGLAAYLGALFVLGAVDQDVRDALARGARRLSLRRA